MEALPQAEHSLKAILDCDSYSEASAFMHLLAEGKVLTMFRFSEYISPTPVDKRMFQLVMQDEARRPCPPEPGHASSLNVLKFSPG